MRDRDKDCPSKYPNSPSELKIARLNTKIAHLNERSPVQTDRGRNICRHDTAIRKDKGIMGAAHKLRRW